MKSLKFLRILFVSGLFLCSSCEEREVWTTLPPETQTGANTFGCYVDGKLFVPDWIAPMEPPLQAILLKNSFILESYADKGKKHIYISLERKPYLNIPLPISYVYYLDKRGDNNCFCFGGKKIGEIFFTKIDTVNHIISGRFQFQGQCWNTVDDVVGDSIVSITNGRFDMKYRYK